MNGGTIFGRDPNLVLQAVQAGISLAVGFGLQWTGEQVALSVVFVGMVLSVIANKKITHKET